MRLLLPKCYWPECFSLRLHNKSPATGVAAATAKSLQSCQTLQPHRQQPTRLPRPWDSQGKNTGVGCHFLLQRMKVKSESEVSQSCPTLSDPMDCSLPGSCVHGIFQARVLEWGAMLVSAKIPCSVIPMWAWWFVLACAAGPRALRF